MSYATSIIFINLKNIPLFSFAFIINGWAQTLYFACKKHDTMIKLLTTVIGEKWNLLKRQ